MAVVGIEEGTLNRLKAYCKSKRMLMSAVVTDVIDEFLNETEGYKWKASNQGLKEMG